MMQLAVFEGWQMRSMKRRLSAALTVAAVTLVAMWLASAVLVAEMPDNHDLSDIGTGVIRSLLTGVAGLLAACSAWLIMRTLHRRNP
ncbi:MAG: hypothetical protein QOE76_1691 [Frankiales bacterium]|jgi:hypothetical protein|nr:hypothetical protein [Frankiales bacterium]